VPFGKDLVFVGTSIGPLLSWLCLERVPVHIEHFLFIFLSVGLALESLLLAVEGSLLDVDLLEVLYVFLDSQGTLAHVVSVDIVEGLLLVVLQKVQPVRGRVESVLDASLELLLALVAEFVLTWPGDDGFICLCCVFEAL
jgi:hypothetical protein